MINIQKLKEEITIDEGRVNYVYSDLDGKPTWPKKDNGKPTFGIGHLLTPKDLEWQTWKKLEVGGKLIISDKRIDEVFEQDIGSCLTDCRKVFDDYDKMIEELQLILANMMFNLGLTRFMGFEHFILAVKSRNYLTAAAEMRNSKWYYQVEKRAERLRKRMIKLTTPNFNKPLLTKEECQNVITEKNNKWNQKFFKKNPIQIN